MPEEINLYEAIKQMRELSSKDQSFSFAHATYNIDKDETKGIRYVANAHLRSAAKGDDVSNADEKLFYYDEDLREPRNCWQILIMFFKDKKCVL